MFDRQDIPHFDNYNSKSFIQYDHKLKHFRCIKINYPNIEIYDGGTLRILTDFNLLE